MTTTIKSDIGEQVIQSRPMRTFEVPDLSEQEYEPLPASVPQSRYPDAEPIGAFNAKQLAKRPQMSFEDIKHAEEAIKGAKAAKYAPSRLSQAAKKRIEMI